MTRAAVLEFHETDAIAAACSYPGCRSAVSPHHSPHLIEAPFIEKLRDQVTALKAELLREWEYNHAEHCGGSGVHHCTWPPSDLLQ